MRQTAIRLDVGDSFYAAIHSTRLTEAVDLLAGAGRPAQATELHDRMAVTLDLVRDTDAMLALRAGLDISPWRLVSAHAMPRRSGERDPALGYSPTPGKPPALDTPTALKLGTDVRLLRDGDGNWRCGGRQYSLVGRHLQNLWQAELACPGYHRKRIATYRRALDGAPEAPAGLVVEIDGTDITEAYYLREIETLRQQEGSRAACFRVPVTKQNEYALTNLPRDCARWLLPHHQITVGREQSVLAL